MRKPNTFKQKALCFQGPGRLHVGRGIGVFVQVLGTDSITIIDATPKVTIVSNTVHLDHILGSNKSLKQMNFSLFVVCLNASFTLLSGLIYFIGYLPLPVLELLEPKYNRAASKPQWVQK